MENLCYIAGTTPAVIYAGKELEAAGIPITHTAEEARYLLLDVPSFSADGCLRSGGDAAVLLQGAREDCMIFGGMLEHSALAQRHCFDLLTRENYLQENARITAHCAAAMAAQGLSRILPHTQTLLIGWGRIGKHLARLLRAMGTPLTVSTRAPEDRALLGAIGYRAAALEEVELSGYQLIINTAPAAVLSRERLKACPHALKLDLASRKGLEDPETIWARGLPGIMAPESSGRLIAQSVQAIIKEEGL